jgi:hypothetical protein
MIHSNRRTGCLVATLAICFLLADSTHSDAQGRAKSHPCTRNFPCAGERFAPVTLKAGQGARVTVANVLIPPADTKPPACPVVIRFFAGDGSLIGKAQEVPLKAGTSASVSAELPSAGLVRAIVSIKDFSDPEVACAVKSAFEVFDANSGATVSALAGQDCLGNGRCGASLADVKVDVND